MDHEKTVDIYHPGASRRCSKAAAPSRARGRSRGLCWSWGRCGGRCKVPQDTGSYVASKFSDAELAELVTPRLAKKSASPVDWARRARHSCLNRLMSSDTAEMKVRQPAAKSDQSFHRADPTPPCQKRIAATEIHSTDVIQTTVASV